MENGFLFQMGTIGVASHAIQAIQSTCDLQGIYQQYLARTPARVRHGIPENTQTRRLSTKTHARHTAPPSQSCNRLVRGQARLPSSRQCGLQPIPRQLQRQPRPAASVPLQPLRRRQDLANVRYDVRWCRRRHWR